MNILFLTTHVNTGGITSYLLTLGEGLVRSGHKVWVASSGGDSESLIEAAGMRNVKVNIRTKSEINPKLVLSFFPLMKLIQKEKIDIIHAQTRVAHVLGTFLCCFTDARLITTYHGFFKARWSRILFPCVGSAVIAVSRPVAQHLNKDFEISQSMINMIPNGIDLERFKMVDQQQRHAVRHKLNIPDDVLLIGIIARLSDVKGIDILIKAMPFVLKRAPSAHLLIVGRGPEEDALKKLTQELDLDACVRFEHTVNQAYRLLAGFDVFVMPSLMEGLGISVMEAQASGIPVVASRVGGLVDLIEDTRTGYLIPSKDPLALADKIVEVLQHPDQAKMVANQARIHINEFFSADLMIKKTLQVYEQYSSR